MVELVRWPSGTRTANEYIAGTAPRGWNIKLECYGFTGGGCYDYGLHVATWGECRRWFEERFYLTASMVELVRWPSGTRTANEYIAGTAPRGWNSKLECYGFIGGGCYDYGLHVDTWGEYRRWFEERFILSSSGYCTKIPCDSFLIFHNVYPF